MTLSNSQSSSGNSTSDVLIHRTTSNSRSCGSSGGVSRRNNCERGQNSKINSSQYHNKTSSESEKSSRSLGSTMPIASACSYSNNDMSSVDQSSTADHGKSKDGYLDDRLYKITPEVVDPAILSRGSASSVRRYTRSALYLLRNDTRSRCRPKCASKLQLLCIWKTNNSNYSNCNQQNGGNSNNSSNSSNNMDMSSSLSSPRMSSITRQQSNNDLQCSGNSGNGSSHHGNQKNYLDHRSISSSHLMPAFAKRRIGNSMQSNSGNSNTANPSANPNDSLKLQAASGKNTDHKQFLSPQRKSINSNQMPKSVQLNSSDLLDVDRERERDHDRERGRDCERDLNFNSAGSSSSNPRERRIGSGRLLPRDVNWDYRSEKEPNSTSSGSMPFEKDLSSHSSSSGNNTQRLSSNSGGNQNSSNQRFDYAHRSPTSKDRNSGGSGKHSSDYRSESRYESRRSYARGDYERDNRGDNSNYVRRFMSDLINQNSNNFAGKSGSTGGGGGSNHNENRRRNHRNDEPEWFSSGPTSQHDTIELRGFDEVEDSNSNSSSSGMGDSKRNKSNVSKHSSKRNRGNNSQMGSRSEISSNEKKSTKETGDSEDQDNTGVNDGDKNKTSREPSSPTVSSTPPPKVTAILKSDTNNNSKLKNCSYNENKPNECDELSSSTMTCEKKTDDVKIILEGDTQKDSSNICETAASTGNQTEDKATGFNFDVFLTVDPLSNLLMGEQNNGENEAGSRFSRWFAKQGDSLKMSEDGPKSQLTEEMVSMLNESQMMKNDRKPLNASESTNTNQSNTLMEFLQRGKINAASGNTEPITNVGLIPSVEELEARMRKIGEESNTSNRDQAISNTNGNMNNPLNQFLTNSVHHHQQQQQKQIQHFVIKNENNQVVPIQNMLGGPQIQQQQHLQVNHSHHTGHLAPSQPQDMEAFKKLLEQITPTSLNAVKLPTQNAIQQLPQQPQQPQMHRLPPLPQPINILTTIGGMPPPAPQHLMKNDEITKFIQQQQLHQRRQQHVMSGPQMNPSTQNDMPIVQAMFLAPQQRFEAQLLLQGLSRGEVTQSTLGHQLSNPNTSPRTKEVLAAVLRESSRDTSPNVIMSAPQIMSPVLGQSHCATNIPPPPPPIIIPNPQQIPINHPPQPGAPQPHPPSGTNPGGLPQRIPSPRELQYHTQSIMQNALIKKKLEEQQENFRRRQEIQKQQQQQMQHKPMQSPSHVEINEFGVIVGSPQQQYTPNQQHQKKSTQQQQQMIQGQQQQRHINSPTPLAFTPTSVLRKMTAEKDSVSSFHTSAPTAATTSVVTATANTSPLMATSAMVPANVGTNNPNPNKPMHSVLMQYQPQQQTNASQNQPRMILGVGSHSQQQQPSVAIIAGPPIQQQQHPDNSRLNQTIRNNQIKWSGAIMNQISIAKPMGRPILKGSLTQSIPPPTNAGLNPIHQHQQQQQQSQTISQAPQMTFASKIEFQQIQQQRVTNNQQQQPHSQKPQLQPIPPPQQSQNILMTQLYQQQQRAALQRAQQYQLHQLHQQQQQQQINIIQSNGNRPVDRIGNNVNTNQPVSNCSNIINYQRDGGLSPTSNQLARWFSPELLAQASAGKLPPLNMNQALSLEEFEKSIQHSSTTVNN